MTKPTDDTPTGDLLLYQTEDGRTRIKCRFEGETVWLTQALMAELFDIGVGTVNHHLKEIYAEPSFRSQRCNLQYPGQSVMWIDAGSDQRRTNSQGKSDM